MKPLSLFILLAILVTSIAFPVRAIAIEQATVATTDSVISEDSLRKRISTRKENPDYQKKIADNKQRILVEQVNELSDLINILDENIGRLGEQIQNKDEQMVELRDSIAPTLLLTSPHESVFEATLISREDVPLPLLPHYDAIARVQDMLNRMKEINSSAETMNNSYRNHSDNERKKAVADAITPLMDDFYELLDFSTDTFSPQQKEYVTKNLNEPYNKYIETYF